MSLEIELRHHAERKRAEKAEADAREQAERASHAEGKADALQNALAREVEQRERVEGERAALAMEIIKQREWTVQAEGEAAALRKALAREARRLEEAEATGQRAETQRDAARDATAAELAAWTAGGPLARAWRGFWRGR